jgi:hypothetical protein
MSAIQDVRYPLNSADSMVERSYLALGFFEAVVDDQFLASFGLIAQLIVELPLLCVLGQPALLLPLFPEHHVPILA